MAPVLEQALPAAGVRFALVLQKELELALDLELALEPGQALALELEPLAPALQALPCLALQEEPLLQQAQAAMPQTPLALLQVL